jgi:hypothetical protein
MPEPGSFSVDALLCDSAVVADGKLYIHGAGWNLITANAVPIVQPRIGLAVLIVVPYTETNRDHEFTIRLVDEDNQQLPIGPARRWNDSTVNREASITGHFTVGRPPTLVSGDSQPLPMALNIDQLEFAAAGLYSFVLSINGEDHSRLSFRIQTRPV